MDQTGALLSIILKAKSTLRVLENFRVIVG